MGTRWRFRVRIRPWYKVAERMSSSTLESLRRLRDAGFSRRFYEIFLTSDPRVARLFRTTDFVRQRELFEHGVQMLLEVARGSAMGRLAIERLARMHGRHGTVPVTADMYTLWLNAFFAAARECDPEWNDSLDAQWKRDLAAGVEMMRAVAAPPRAARS